MAQHQPPRRHRWVHHQAAQLVAAGPMLGPLRPAGPGATEPPTAGAGPSSRRRPRPTAPPPAASGSNPASASPTATQRPAMAPSVSTMRRSMALSRCWTRKDRWPTFHSATPRRSWGRSSLSVDESSRSDGGGGQFARRLGVDDTRLGVGQEPLGQRHLLRVGCADRMQIRHAVQDGHVGHAEGPRQFPGGLQPAGHTEIGEDRPGLVDHQEHLSAGAVAPAGVAGQRGLQPGGGAGHQNAQCGRGVERREIEHDQRGREVQARCGRPVEHAPQVAGDQPSQLERHVPAILEQGATLGAQGRRGGCGGCQQRLHHHAGRSGPRPWRLCHRGGAHRGPERGPLAGQQVAAEAGAGQRGQQFQSTARRAVGAVQLVAVGAGVERVEADGPAGSQRHRAHPPGIGQVAVLAFGVDHPRPATEHGLPPQKGLDEGALAPPDLAEDHHVGVGDHAGGVELERVVDEGPTQQVIADHRTSVTQAGLSDEGVGRPEVARGHLMGRDAPHCSPRASGSVQV